MSEPDRRWQRRHVSSRKAAYMPTRLGYRRSKAGDMFDLLMKAVQAHGTMLPQAPTFAASTAFAQSCETKAMSKDGKPLSGAAKTSFVNKCKKDTCKAKAVSAEGKKLAGAAKNSFMKKRESEA